MKDLQFGTAERNINPEVPISLAGYFNPRMWDHVLDDLHVRALVMQQGEARFALVQFDLLYVTSDFADLFWELLGTEDGFSPETSLLTATHTHTAPNIRGKTEHTQTYVRMAAERGVEALREAAASLREAVQVNAGWGEDRRFAFNRRYWMRNGTVVTNPPPRDPQVLKPEGDVDLGIPVVRLADAAGRSCILANITNHTDTLGGCGVSADWPGFVQKRLREEYGAETTVFSLIGAAGNINHFDPFSAERNSGYAETERIGTGYAETILEALERAQPLPDATLRVGAIPVETPTREVSPDEMAEANATIEELQNVPDPETAGVTLTSEDLALGTPIARKFFASQVAAVASDTRPRRFLLTGFRLGTWAVTSLPSEPFVEIALTIRNEILTGLLSMVVSHGNGTGGPGLNAGYIANRWNHGRGGYETTVRSGPTSVTTAERLLEGSRALAEQLDVD